MPPAEIAAELVRLGGRVLRSADSRQLSGEPSDLLGSIEIAVLDLGRDLRLRHFTPAATEVLGLSACSLGRTLTNRAVATRPLSCQAKPRSSTVHTAAASAPSSDQSACIGAAVERTLAEAAERRRRLAGHIDSKRRPEADTSRV